MNNRNSRLIVPFAGTLVLLAACGVNDAEVVTEETIAEKQAELEQLQADLAEQQAADAVAPPAATVEEPPRPSAAPRPASTRPSTPSAPRPAPVSTVTVPAGTELALSLSTALSSKSTKSGDPVRAMLTSDVRVDGRTAIASGTTVAGSVVKVVSGSDKIGGTPTLVVAFDRIELPGGKDVPITGELTSRGKSDNTRDTVKIVGGAAAGALLGDQVSNKDRGKVIGGLLGAAAGAIAAKETGTEVKLAEGTALTLALGAPVEITQ